jgi:hypothetical protein
MKKEAAKRKPRAKKAPATKKTFTEAVSGLTEKKTKRKKFTPEGYVPPSRRNLIQNAERGAKGERKIITTVEDGRIARIYYKDQDNKLWQKIVNREDQRPRYETTRTNDGKLIRRRIK